MLEQISGTQSQEQTPAQSIVAVASETRSANVTAIATNVAEHFPIPAPDRDVTDTIWLIIIVAFAIVLVGSFITLAASVVLPVSLKSDANPQIILTIFTTVTGFLAGLFTTSPFQSSSKKA